MRTRRGLKRAYSIARELRHESIFTTVVRRQNGLCWYCGEAMGADCSKEHLHSQSAGGTDYWPRGNLKASHTDCNQAAGHLDVELKHRLREICLIHGKTEMFDLARQFRRAQAREAFVRLGPIHKRRR